MKIAIQKISRLIRYSRKTTPQRGQETLSTFTISLHLGHLRRTMGAPRCLPNNLPFAGGGEYSSKADDIFARMARAKQAGSSSPTGLDTDRVENVRRPCSRELVLFPAGPGVTAGFFAPGRTCRTYETSRLPAGAPRIRPRA